MHLDVGTLSVVTVFVMALLGALLVFAGMQNRSIRALLWWGAAQIVGAIGLGLISARGFVPDFISTDIANALVLLPTASPGLEPAYSTTAKCCRAWSCSPRFCG